MLNLLSKEIKLIGIHGKAGSGKDFFAKNVLTDYFKIALADHFKNELVGKEVHSYEEVFYTKPPEVRHSLQDKGSKEGRDVFGINVWVNVLESSIRNIQDKNDINNFCITDIRYDNEAEWIISNGGIIINIISDRVHTGMDEKAKEHKSEAGIHPSLISKTICNNIGATIDNLRDQLINS
jgi:hypothetical protein